jgi:NAD(P)-dependent dehydrogenase (short-subunit alcohol dehydrogenase family)
VRALGRRAIAVPTDITSLADCARLVGQAEEELGGVDVLVNNAYHPGTYELFEAGDLERWRAPLEVNLLGSLRLTQEAIPRLKKRGGGSVVFVNSMIVREVLPTMASYAASKGALLAAAQGLARELGPHRIRVNSVLPGYIWGATLEGYFKAQAAARGVTPEAIYGEVAAKIALGKIPTSEEVAGAVLFFASDLSRAITGQTLDVNGGQVMA